MPWYDYFSRVYDASLESLYAEQRVLAVEALSLSPGAVVLDVPCGTGQSLDGLSSGVGPAGTVFAVDASAGMLSRAQRRSQERQLTNVVPLQASASSLPREQLVVADGSCPPITHLHIFLGMSVFDDMQACFANLFSLLAPGGRCVLVDVHTESLGVQGRMVNWIAGADIRRRFWEPLEQRGVNFARHDLPYRRQHGGQIMLAVADKPASDAARTEAAPP